MIVHATSPVTYCTTQGLYLLLVSCQLLVSLLHFWYGLFALLIKCCSKNTAGNVIHVHDIITHFIIIATLTVINY